jgi:hypothetical protein
MQLYSSVSMLSLCTDDHKIKAYFSQKSSVLAIVNVTHWLLLSLFTLISDFKMHINKKLYYCLNYVMNEIANLQISSDLP